MNPTSLPIEQIVERLKANNNPAIFNIFPDSFFDSPPKPAAILVPLLEAGGKWHLLYIRRTEIPGDYHSGQVAFPGGAREQTDFDLKYTALREANEEIGLIPENVKIIGQLPDVITISNFHVRSYIGEIKWPFDISISEDEVVRAFTIPLSWLANANNFRLEHRNIPGIDMPQPVVYYEKYQGELLWGFSARITTYFLETINLL